MFDHPQNHHNSSEKWRLARFLRRRRVAHWTPVPITQHWQPYCSECCLRCNSASGCNKTGPTCARPCLALDSICAPDNAIVLASNHHYPRCKTGNGCAFSNQYECPSPAFPLHLISPLYSFNVYAPIFHSRASIWRPLNFFLSLPTLFFLVVSSRTSFSPPFCAAFPPSSSPLCAPWQDSGCSSLYCWKPSCWDRCVPMKDICFLYCHCAIISRSNRINILPRR